MKQHLTGRGVPYRVNLVPNSTRCQIFLRDPNNVEIEAQFRNQERDRRLTPAVSVNNAPNVVMAGLVPRLSGTVRA